MRNGFPALAWYKRKVPLGFTQYSLHLGRLVFSAHSWTPGTADPDIHDHAFSFISLVARGKMEEKTYRLVPGESHVIVGFLPQSTPAPGQRLTSVAPATTHHRRAGTLYWCKRGQFHQVTSAPRLTLLVKWLPALPWVTYAVRTAPR